MLLENQSQSSAPIVTRVATASGREKSTRICMTSPAPPANGRRSNVRRQRRPTNSLVFISGAHGKGSDLSGRGSLEETENQIRFLLGVPLNRLGGVHFGDRAEADLHQCR